MSAIKFIPEKDVILIPIMKKINNNDNNNTNMNNINNNNNHTIMIVGIATAITISIAIAVFSIIRKNTKSKNELIRFSELRAR